jgi:phenylacetate-CoA ligase
VLLEVLADGRPAAAGERGEVSVTLLHSYAMPILRYRLGHHATRGGPCACGAPYSTILAPDV